MSKFKRGDRVTLVSNKSASRHHVGDRGTVIDITPYSYPIHENVEDEYVYRISAGGYGGEGSWSFTYDLKKTIVNLNNSTRTI